jgi:predicted PurR-regulated permease PerM
MQNVNKCLLTIVILIVGVLFYFLSHILTPFLIAALLAYLADPLVERLTRRWHLPRLVSTMIVFLMMIIFLLLLVLLLVPLIQKQIETLTIVIPNIINWFQHVVFPWLANTFGFDEQINLETIKTTLADNWSKAGGAASWVLKTALHSGMTIIEWLTNLILIPVVTFYLLRDWKQLLTGIRGLLPRKIEPTIVKLTKESDAVLSAFFRGQLLVMLALGIIYSMGLTAIGLQIGLIIGLISGLVSIVPYLGFIVGIVAASIAAYVQFGTLSAILLVWLVYAIGQMLESTFLTPKLVGDRIGLHPVAVIFAVLAGGSLFGFFGVLLALPVAAVIMVWLRFLNHKYRHSRLYA